MRKKSNEKNIKISLAVSLFVVFTIGILSLLYDFYAATLMPGAVIASYVIIVFHVFLFWRTLDDGVKKNSVKNVLITITISGLVINLIGILVGGGIYNFERCVIVFSIVLIPWLSTLCLTYIFYLSRQVENEEENH